MLNRILKRAAGLSASLIILSAIAFAQTGPIEGTVKVKAEDGTLKPVADALVEIYRVDIKGRWEVKTDKSGRYVRLGMPLAGQFIVVASGPGIQPTWINNVKITQSPVVDIVANPGDGSKLTLEQIQAQIKEGRSAPPAAGQPAPSTGDKAKMEAAKKEYDAKVKEAQELQANFDQLRTRYNQGIELMKTNNYQAAMSEFEAAAAVDPSKHAAFAELSYKANANLAEAHYQIGVDLFNKKNKPEAKPHFEKAVEAINKAITVASTSTSPTINNDLIVYYNILAKNAVLLVQYYGAINLIPDTVKAFEKAETLDATNKNKWSIYKADIYRFAGSEKMSDAVAAYKAVLAADPNNVDALYGLGLTLIAASEKAQIQEGANALADFVSKAPATDKRVPDVKEALQAVKNAYNVEAEKPSKRRGRP